MKVFLLIRSLNVGGAERQIVTLANALAQSGHKVDLGVFYAGGMLTKELNSRVNLIDLKKKSRWDMLPFMARLVKHIRRTAPDVIYTFLGTANVVCALLKPFFRKTPLVWSVLASNMNLSQFGIIHQLHFRLECLLSRIPNTIIANSHAGKKHAAEYGFPEDRIEVIPNGIDTEKFQPGIPPDPNIKRDGQRSVGIVARLDPMKDHETFIRAAALVASDLTDVHFYCIGHAPQKQRQPFEQLAEKLGISDKLHWTQARTDMPTVYCSLDVSCLASFGEGTPNVLLEAMACGTPCVSTDVGDAKQLLMNTGEIVPVGNPELMAQAISNMLHRLENEPDLPQRCRKRIKDSYSLKKHLAETSRALQTVSGN